MTNNSGNRLALAAALSLLGASLGVSAAQAANSDATSIPNKVELAALFLKHEATSTQIKGETTSTQIKGETTSNQQKCTPMTAQWIKLHQAEANQIKMNCAAQSNQIKLNQSNQIKLNQSNQIKLDTTH